MPAYVILIRDRMKDAEEFGQYQQKARSARGDHPITPLAFYGACETWEGEDVDGAVILQFPTMDAARAWYDSTAYQEARQHRVRAADYRVILVEGV